ncbi:MAG TPA: hypothetical protein VFL83_18060 [Anaeromyxobacter sp.]|nr:hypothetical protein [Anaeromyxobacter sp.]
MPARAGLDRVRRSLVPWTAFSVAMGALALFVARRGSGAPGEARR